MSAIVAEAAPHTANDELALDIMLAASGVSAALRLPAEKQRKGSQFAEDLMRLARRAEAHFRAADPDCFGACGTCSDPNCYRNQPPADWPDRITHLRLDADDEVPE